MSKAVMISIQPRWCEKIAVREKSLEVRKTKPNIQTPFKCYIYQTKRKWLYKILEKLSSLAWARTVTEGRGKVIGEFVCDRIYQYTSDMFRSVPAEETDITTADMTKLSCLTAKELYEYEYSAEAKENCIYLIGVYGWHISDLVIYDKPRKLADFHGLRKTKFGFAPVALTRPPQSWYYVEEAEK